MKKVLMLLALVLVMGFAADAQCSICTKTAAQLGETPARGLNTGILYLAFAPLAIVGFIAWRWFKSKDELEAGAVS